MSDKLLAMESEFNQVKRDLKSNHKELLKDTRNLLKIIKDTVSESGPLYAKEFSSKVIDTASSIENDVILRLEEVFNATEETIENFEISVKNIDSTC